MISHFFAVIVPLTTTAVPATAQNAASEIQSIFDQCHTWVLHGQTNPFSTDWHLIVDVPRVSADGTTNRKVYLSSHHPLKVETRTSNLTSLQNGQPVTVRDCQIENVDTSQGVFRHRLRAIDVGKIWDNLTPLPSQDIKEHLQEMQLALQRDPAFREDNRQERPSAHEENRTFWLCSTEYFLTIMILPDGVLETSTGWLINVSYRHEPGRSYDNDTALCSVS